MDAEPSFTRATSLAPAAHPPLIRSAPHCPRREPAAPPPSAHAPGGRLAQARDPRPHLEGHCCNRRRDPAHASALEDGGERRSSPSHHPLPRPWRDGGRVATLRACWSSTATTSRSGAWAHDVAHRVSDGRVTSQAGRSAAHRRRAAPSCAPSVTSSMNVGISAGSAEFGIRLLPLGRIPRANVPQP